MIETHDSDFLSMFGLSVNQSRILFSIENLLIEKDIRESKKDRELKQLWLNEWSETVLNYLSTLTNNGDTRFYTRSEIFDAIDMEDEKNINKTWYYLIMLEVSLFQPYTQLGKSKEDDDKYKKLKFSNQTSALEIIVKKNEIMSVDYIERFRKTYNQTLTQLSGKRTKIALGAVSTLAIAAIFAATAGALAGPIAVAMFGGQFAGLGGAALTQACLALAGGGALAVGGSGVAGGTMIIVGGGALLGMASGGTAVGGAALLLRNAPDFTFTQAAKLEVVLKEIILNAQQDVVAAQKILENQRNQIAELYSELAKLKLDRAKDRKAINNMEKSIEYLERAYSNMKIFTSSYEVGLSIKG